MFEIPDLHPMSARRRGIMLAQPFDETRFKKWGFKAMCQPKLDGERCRVIINLEGKAILLSSEENIITSVPHINEELESLGWYGIELDGELYAHDMKFEDIHSRVSRKKNEHSDAAAIGFHCFDIVLPISQQDRTMLLESSSLESRPHLHIIKHRIVEGIDEAFAMLNAYHQEGYEGIILRHPAAEYERKRSLWIMKFKPKKEDIYEIVGSVEEVSMDGIPKGRLGALICRGTDNSLFNVGTGFDPQTRQHLWEIRDVLPGQYVRVQYQHLTAGRGVPRFPVCAGLWNPSQLREG